MPFFIGALNSRSLSLQQLNARHLIRFSIAVAQIVGLPEHLDENENEIGLFVPERDTSSMHSCTSVCPIWALRHLSPDLTSVFLEQRGSNLSLLPL